VGGEGEGRCSLPWNWTPLDASGGLRAATDRGGRGRCKQGTGLGERRWGDSGERRRRCPSHPLRTALRPTRSKGSDFAPIGPTPALFFHLQGIRQCHFGTFFHVTSQVRAVFSRVLSSRNLETRLEREHASSRIGRCWCGLTRGRPRVLLAVGHTRHTSTANAASCRSGSPLT